MSATSRFAALALALCAMGLTIYACDESAEPFRPRLVEGAIGPVLTVTAGGSGSGTVSTSPAGVACSYAAGTTGTSDCQESYAAGTAVTLTATAVTGSNFVSWSGDCGGTVATCTVSMSVARNVKANWSKGPYTVAVSGTGSGSVSSTPAGITCTITAGSTTGSDCSESYPFGTSVTLTQTAAAGYAFAGWTGACTGTGACTVVANQSSKAVGATFTASSPPKLTVTGAGEGSGRVTSQAGLTPAIDCAISAGTAAASGCTGDYSAGAAVTLSAAPQAGSSFSGWSGACTGTGACQLTMSQARSVTATFVTAVTSTRATQGEWGPVFSTPVVAVHLSLLPTGKLLLWGHVGEPYLWDPTAANPSAGYAQVSTPTELFCAGHTFLPDGKLLVSGGHISNDHGLPDANLFDPATESWSKLPPMKYGRWYPTSVALSDGQVVNIAGGDQNGVWVPIPERWDGTQFVELSGANKTLNYYPRAFVAPNGKIFIAGEDQPSRWLTPGGTGAYAWGPYRNTAGRSYGSAVEYLPGKILYAGGGDPPTSSAEVIDLNAASPQWRLVAPMSAARRHLNATLLADGKVLINGGTSAAGFSTESGSEKTAELWNPSTETWTKMASESIVRVYHATALLLPDARVISSGSGDGQGVTFQNNAQIFTPPYLFNPDGSLATRPVITTVNGTAAAALHYGALFTVETPDAATVGRGMLVRLASVTHAFNESQGAFPVTFTRPSTGVLQATAPTNGNIAPPGPYMLFLLNGSGVPSVAKVVTVGP